ncbi:MAG: PrsW family intramembrane metalloprotease [Prevotella sp.]|nr:PrsW family intramembrane metalloprotease [Prevotella sp.]
MVNELIILACALLPALALMIFIYNKDKNPEPPRVVAKGFLLGMALALPVSIAEYFISGLLSPFIAIPLLGAVVQAFAVAALPEETGKLLMLKWLVRQYPEEMDERIDGIVYAVSIGLGFAAIENVVYLFSNADAWVMVGISRALLAVPGHYAFGILMGYYFSLYYFGEKTEHNRISILLVPVMAHGIYDTLCFASEIVPALGGFITIILVYFCYRMHVYALTKVHEHAGWDEAAQRLKQTRTTEGDEWERAAEALRKTIENHRKA